MLYREIYGGVVETRLSGNISSSANSITVVDGSTFPSGVKPFAVVIDRGTPSEEKILIASRSGNILTVSQRGYDATPAASHANTAPIDHVVDATTLQDMNTTTYDSKLLLWVGL